MAQDIKIKISVDGRDGEAAVRRLSSEFSGLQGGVERAARASESATASLARMGHAAAALAAANLSFGSLRQAADAWSSLNAQLQIATGSATAGAAAYREVLAIATQTGQSLGQVGTVYRRFAESATALGLSLRQVADISRTVAQTMALSGGSAASAEAALVQFGQALASGQLRGEELNSVLEQAPRLARALADGLGAPVGKLRELAQAGDLTSERLVEALGKSAQQVSAEFEQLPLTISRAMENLRTSFTDAVGSVEQSTGAFGAVAQAIDGVAKNMGVLADGAALAAAVLATRYAVALGKAKADTIALAIAKQTAIRAEVAHQQALAATALSAATYSRAMMAAAAAQAQLTTASTLARGAMAALGGPVGIVTTALTAGVTAWALWGSSAEEASRKAAVSARENIQSVIDELTRLEGSLGSATRKQVESGIRRAANTLTETALARDRVQRELAKLQNLGDESMWSPSQVSRARELELEYNQLLAREKTLQTQIASLRDQAAEAGVDGVKRFVEAHAVGADKIAAQQAALRAEFERVMTAAGGYSAANPAHVQALDTLNAKLKDLEKSGQKGAAGPRAVRAEMDALGILILAWNEAEKERTKLAAEYAQSITNYMRPLEEQARTLESQLETYGLTERQIQLTTVARLEEARAIAAANGALPEHLNFLDREIELRRRIAAASGQMEVREANTEAARQAEEDWRRTSQAIEDALIDALMNGGKSGAEYIEGLFRSMVLRPIVQAIVQPIAGGITSAMGVGAPGAGGAGGNLLSMASNLSSLSSLGSIGSSLGMMAGSFGAGTTMTATQLGNLANAGLVSPGAATAGWGAANLGPGLAAYGLGQKYGVLGGLAGGVGTSALVGGVGGLASGAGFISGASGALAGLGPAGWAAIAVGAILGSIMGNKKPSDKSSWATVDPASGKVSDLGSMTGKKDPGQEQRDATAALAASVGQFAAQAGVDSALKVMIGQRDGIRLELMDGWQTPQGTASNGGGANLLNYGSDLQTSFAAMLDDLIDEGMLDSETIDLWRKMKTDMVGVAREADELVSTLNLLVAGYDEATIERANLLQAEGEALEAALGRMLQIETALSGKALPGDALAQAAGEMARQLEALALSAIPTTNTELNKLVTGLDLTSAEGQKTYQSLMALAPAFVEIQAAQKTLYDQLYTDEQRAANLAQELGDAFAQLGVAMPATRDEMRALIDAQDASAEAGAKMRAQLLGLVPAFVEVSDAAAAAAAEAVAVAQRAAEASRREAEAALRTAYSRESTELRQTVTQFDALSRSLRELRQQLLIGAESPLSRAALEAETSRQFEEVAARANSGDAAAIDQLRSLTSAYLEVGASASASAEDYYRRFARVQGVLESTESASKRQADSARMQLDRLDAQVGALIEINTSVLSVRDAINALLTVGATEVTASPASDGNRAGWVGEIRVNGRPVTTADRVGEAYTISDDNLKRAAGLYGETGIKGYAMVNGRWVPQYAAGGFHGGGVRIVGELGPELEVTGPARIWNAEQTRELLRGGDNEKLIEEIRALRAEVATLRAAATATARATTDTARLLARTTNGGNAMLVETAA